MLGRLQVFTVPSGVVYIPHMHSFSQIPISFCDLFHCFMWSARQALLDLWHTRLNALVAVVNG